MESMESPAYIICLLPFHNRSVIVMVFFVDNNKSTLHRRHHGKVCNRLQTFVPFRNRLQTLSTLRNRLQTFVPFCNRLQTFVPFRNGLRILRNRLQFFVSFLLLSNVNSSSLNNRCCFVVFIIMNSIDLLESYCIQSSSLHSVGLLLHSPCRG